MTSQLQIMQLGAAILRETAQPITDFNAADATKLVSDLLYMMLDGNGVGIAAPQIGVSLQMVIIASRPTSRYPHAPEMSPIVMINPHFEITDDTVQKDWEGCLSIPGVRALVPRYRAIKVFYQTAQGEARHLELDDFPARVFQHEYDHLQGLVYLDRVENNRDIFSETEFQKLVAKE
jgi:peptide deformylase